MARGAAAAGAAAASRLATAITGQALILMPPGAACRRPIPGRDDITYRPPGPFGRRRAGLGDAGDRRMEAQRVDHAVLRNMAQSAFAADREGLEMVSERRSGALRRRSRP